MPTHEQEANGYIDMCSKEQLSGDTKCLSPEVLANPQRRSRSTCDQFQACGNCLTD